MPPFSSLARRLGLQFSWGAAAAGIPLFVFYLLIYWITVTFVRLLFPSWTLTFPAHAPFALMVLLLVVIAVLEEIVVTAGVIELLSARGAAVAIGASTLLRFVWHLVQGPLAALSVVPVGLLFATLYWRRRTLWPLMIAHAIAEVVIYAGRPD